jgi:hypothetical protein
MVNHKVFSLYTVEYNGLCYYGISYVLYMYQLRQENMTAERAALEPPQIQFSAGMTPGKLPGVDGRTWPARRYRELVAAMSSDLGGELSTCKAAIVCRSASLMTWCEQQEAEHANSGKLDIQVYTTAVNSLRRLLADLGLERVAREVPDLQTWLRKREVTT